MNASPRLSRLLWLAASLMAGTTISRSALAPGAPVPDPNRPQYQGKGEQDRSYEFPGTGEKIAYHLYVPAKWTPSTKLPLVIVTHGAAQPATAPFQRPKENPTLAKTAEERGIFLRALK